jgi:hypothetical protein
VQLAGRLPLILWFGWRVWQEMGGGASREHAPDEVNAEHTVQGLI